MVVAQSSPSALWAALFATAGEHILQRRKNECACLPFAFATGPGEASRERET
jgi:hypothetical protein